MLVLSPAFQLHVRLPNLFHIALHVICTNLPLRYSFGEIEGMVNLLH